MIDAQKRFERPRNHSPDPRFVIDVDLYRPPPPINKRGSRNIAAAASIGPIQGSITRHVIRDPSVEYCYRGRSRPVDKSRISHTKRIAGEARDFDAPSSGRGVGIRNVLDSSRLGARAHRGNVQSNEFSRLRLRKRFRDWRTGGAGNRI